jgi:hypothetical protein
MRGMGVEWGTMVPMAMGISLVALSVVCGYWYGRVVERERWARELEKWWRR